MKKNLIIVLVSILLVGCGVKDLTDSSANNSASSSTIKPAVGDSVVAKTSSTRFAEGKIQVIDGQKANIAWSRKDSTNTDVDLANVYLLPKPGVRSGVKTDDFVIAKTATNPDYTDWTLVQVTSVTDSVITVKDQNNSAYNLIPEKVIAVSPTDAADIKNDFDKNAKQKDFDRKAQVGRPVAPDGYKPKVGETVFAASSPTFWYVGQVKSINGNSATILYENKQNGTFETTLDKIVPNPTAAGATMPAVNDYILVRSPSCLTCFFTYTQVTAVNGTNIDSKDRDDNKYTTRPGDFVLLK